MSSNKNVVPEAKEALNRFKMEAASDWGVQTHQKKININKHCSYISEKRRNHAGYGDFLYHFHKFNFKLQL